MLESLLEQTLLQVSYNTCQQNLKYISLCHITQNYFNWHLIDKKLVIWGIQQKFNKVTVKKSIIKWIKDTYGKKYQFPAHICSEELIHIFRILFNPKRDYDELVRYLTVIKGNKNLGKDIKRQYLQFWAILIASHPYVRIETGLQIQWHNNMVNYIMPTKKCCKDAPKMVREKYYSDKHICYKRAVKFLYNIAGKISSDIINGLILLMCDDKDHINQIISSAILGNTTNFVMMNPIFEDRQINIEYIWELCQARHITCQQFIHMIRKILAGCDRKYFLIILHKLNLLELLKLENGWNDCQTKFIPYIIQYSASEYYVGDDTLSLRQMNMILGSKKSYMFGSIEEILYQMSIFASHDYRYKRQKLSRDYWKTEN
jgi:hypothetical protein